MRYNKAGRLFIMNVLQKQGSGRQQPLRPQKPGSTVLDSLRMSRPTDGHAEMSELWPTEHAWRDCSGCISVCEARIRRRNLLKKRETGIARMKLHWYGRCHYCNLGHSQDPVREMESLSVFPKSTQIVFGQPMNILSNRT